MHYYTCLLCQNQFTHKQKFRKYCSYVCSTKNRKRIILNSKCLYCKKDFYAHGRGYNRKLDKNCSRICRNLYYKSVDYLKESYEKFVIKKDNECWDWIGLKTPQNYSVLNFLNKPLRANRASWMIHFGDIPRGYFVCHSCDNPICTNPDHLFLGTPKDNMHDMVKKGRKKVRRGENNHFAKRTEDVIKKIKIMIKEGKKDREIAETLNENRRYVTSIRLGDMWKHITID